MTKAQHDFGSKKKKWILIVIIFLILATVGVTLGITYWPVKPEVLFEQFSEQGSVVDEDSDAYKKIVAFGDHYTYLSATYQSEYKVCINVMQSVRTSMDFYECYMINSISSGMNRIQVKAVQSGLKTAKSNIEKMADYLDTNDKLFTNSTVVNHGWEGIRDYYKEFINNYAKAYEALANIYESATFQGVYGNDVSVLTVKGMSAYINSINTKLFDEKSASTAQTISVNMKNFSNFYYNTNKDLISQYYITESYQANADMIFKLEEKTDNKINFTYLLEHNFDCSKLVLSIDANTYIARAANFLKAVRVGGIA